jgi:hypothetical protein
LLALKPSLSYIFNTAPTEPSINPWQQQAHANPAAYALPFQGERDLVTTLACLSDIGQYPNHVPALCMKETPGTDVSEVIIAVI